MQLEVELPQDKSGTRYFGIVIPERLVQPDLDNLARFTTEQRLVALLDSRKPRDAG